MLVLLLQDIASNLQALDRPELRLWERGLCECLAHHILKMRLNIHTLCECEIIAVLGLVLFDLFTFKTGITFA